MKRSIPLSDFIEPQQHSNNGRITCVSFKCSRAKYDDSIIVDGEYKQTPAHLRAILVQLARRFTLKVISAIEEIYLDGVLYYTDIDDEQRRVAEEFEMNLIEGKVKIDKKTGTEKMKIKKNQKIKRDK